MSPRRVPPLVLLTLGLCGLPARAAPPSTNESHAAAERFFETKIRPVLVARCYECHSAEASGRGKLKAGLQLDTRAGTLAGGESGPGVVPGQPDESLLLAALKYDGLEMPPDEPLPSDVVADFERWIREGAYDPREGAVVKTKRGLTIDEGRRFWSFVPPQPPPLPAVRRAGRPRDDVDRFIWAAQEQQGLAPSPEADPRTLVRRLYFDLLGLPPEPEEVEAFVARAASQPDVAYRALVDRLLASPHFGERWGRHWLDVARYADSNGRDRNVYYYHAWRYRDYVIGALNDDVPYDRFVQEQIAGDLLPAESREQRDRQRIATGFLALGAKAFEEQKQEVFRMDVVDEQIEVVGRAILGLSVGCARCHDHKFDPIPTADYYALAGIFRSTQPLYGYGTKGIKATAHHHTELIAVGPDAERLGPDGLKYLARLHELTLAQNTARSDRYRVVRQLSAAKLDRSRPGADQARFDAEIARMEAEIKDWDVKVKGHEAALQQAMDSAPPMPGWAMGVRERETAEDCRIHVRGDVQQLGDVVPRGMLQVVALPAAAKLDTKRSGRLELARWLTDRRHPLTARVYVNRIWQHLFGRGLVATPDDFGVNGARPSHAELLDHLAVRFMDDGWSTKRLVRALVLSSTYRQGAGEVAASDVVDPDGTYLARRRARRLSAEVLRDAIVHTAGTFKPGPPPRQEAFLAKFNPYREDEYRTFQPLFLPADVEHSYRSVYLPVVRGVLPEMFALFDFASPDRTTSVREESIVPAQSLYFMNNAWVVAQARALSERLLSDAQLDDAARVGQVYRRAFAREATADELRRALQYLSAPESIVADPKSKSAPSDERLRLERWTSFCQAVFASAEFRYVP